MFYYIFFTWGSSMGWSDQGQKQYCGYRAAAEEKVNVSLFNLMKHFICIYISICSVI